VKLLMDEASTIAFLLILQILGFLRDAPRMDSIKKVDENLCSVCLLVQNELVHKVKPPKKGFP